MTWRALSISPCRGGLAQAGCLPECTLVHVHVIQQHRHFGGAARRGPGVVPHLDVRPQVQIESDTWKQFIDFKFKR